jgi:hypothetical protein
VPLVSKDGKWRFDVDAGEQEIAFRRIGNDEMTAIDTCLAIVRAIGMVTATPATRVYELWATGESPVYERDLGRNTATVAESMKSWMPNGNQPHQETSSALMRFAENSRKNPHLLIERSPSFPVLEITAAAQRLHGRTGWRVVIFRS